MDASRGVSAVADAVDSGEGCAALPAGLREMAPGAELAALLESVDHFAVDPDEMEDLLHARARQIWHLQAEQMIDMYLTERSVRERIGSVESPGLARRHAVEYVAWQLRCSPRWARSQLDLAGALLTLFPDVFAAVDEGRLDPARAGAFVELLTPVEDEATARWILDRLLTKAPQWTLPELRERLRYHVDRRAPQAARRRYQRRVTDRNVELTPEPDGTATLSGVGLPPHRAAAAYDRIDRLARAARSAGDARTITQLRADAFTDLLTGTPFQLTPSVDPLTAEADTHRPHSDADGPAGRCGPGGGGQLEGPLPPEPIGRESLIDVYDYERVSREDQTWADGHTTPASAAHPEVPGWWRTCTPARPAGTTTINSRFENGNPDAVLAGDRCAGCGGVLPGQRPGAVQISVKLSTLLGRDDHPALVPGLGPVVADLARQIAADRQLDPVWRWSVFDSHGDLLHHGSTTHRATPASRRNSRFQTGKTEDPCTCPRLQPGNRRSVVELQLTPTDLTPDCPAAWQAVIADIAAQVTADAHANPPGKWSDMDGHGRLRDHGHTTRHPNAEEAAFIRARDRTCRAPHCRRRATTCDLDHAIEHRDGGPSHRGNCRCLCRTHHTMRHQPGVQVTDHTTDRGRVTTWTTPDGHTYHVTHDNDIILTVDDEEP